MPHPISVPRLGWSMEEGTFGHWLKRDGEAVRAGDPLYVLEGEKASQDIESLDAGVLRIPLDGPQPGAIVKVGQVLAYLVAAGEAAPFEQPSGPADRASSAAPLREDEPRGSGVVSPEPRGLSPRKGTSQDLATPSTHPAASPSVRRLARELGVDLARVTGSGSGGRVMPEDVAAANQAASSPSPAGRLRITPRARRAARERGVELSAIVGTGRHGRIRERDVPAAANGSRGGDSASVAPLALSAPPAVAGRLIPLTPIRRTIAARMVAGVQQAAPVTLQTQIDATGLVQLRGEFREAAERRSSPSVPAEAGAVPSYTDLIVKLTAAALRQHPQMLLQWRDDGLLEPDGLHISVAVDTPAGLLAPVVRDADRLSLRQISQQLAQLAAEAREGKLRSDQLSGGVFTVTNLGTYGVDHFTPILNLPQSGILGVGRIRQEPAVVAGVVVPRAVLALSLTFDHRAVDGAPAARFLQTLSQCLEQPGAWLMS